jgi:Flp pilus assembly protein TadG
MSLLKTVRSLARDTRANVATIWAIALLPILGVAGITLDAQIAFKKKERVQHAIDSAVLAGARMLQSSNSQADGIVHAQTYFDALTGQEAGMVCGDLAVTFPADEEIKGSVDCSQDTVLSNIVGRPTLDFTVESVATFGIGKLDVAFVFDISGSMNSNGRLWDLKTAAKDAIDTLMPAAGSIGDGDVRIALTSYNSMIDAGPYFEEVTGLKKYRTYSATETYWDEECAWQCTKYKGDGRCKDWDYECEWVEKEFTTTKSISSTCVYERDGTYKFDEKQPTQKSSHQLVDELQSGQPRATTDSDNSDGFLSAAYARYNSYYNYWYVVGDDCLGVDPMELNDNATQLKHYITGLYANGGTAGHQGIAWGWYLISPQWKDVFDNDAEPMPYNEPDSMKAMIIMTDGEFNSQLYSSQGGSTSQAEEVCDAIKEENILVYTIAFDAPEEGQDVLEYCASSPEFYFNATNGEELSQSYQAIATSISDLRIKS